MLERRSLLILWGALLAGGLWAAELPLPLRDGQLGLRPAGEATLHWFGLHVYDVALFLQEGAYTTNGQAAICIRYAIPIKHQRLLETTLKEWRRLGWGGDAQREQWIRRLEPLWPDLKPGDRLTAFRLREGPTRFYFGDRLLGEVADPAFGPAFFAIWLDAGCRYPKVRTGLLGNKTR